MTNNELVSVIVPVHNGESFVYQAVESALCQTYRNLEVIIIDDGSTDRTHLIADTLAEKDSRVRVIRQENAGVARARNLAIGSARGDFVATLDADDIWDPRKIERQLWRMLQAGDDTGLVYSWWVWIDLKGAVLDRSPRWMIEGHAFETLLRVNFTGNASVPLFRRRCLEVVGGYSEAFAASGAGGCEDWDLALRIASQYQVALVPELLVGYRRRFDSMSSACGTMWRSHRLITKEAQCLRPNVSQLVVKQSSSQFALYLAGVSYWSRNYGQAILWGFRAGFSELTYRVLPCVVLMILRRLRGFSANPQVMRPGVILDAGLVAEPLIPYDRFYQHTSQECDVPTIDAIETLKR